MTPALADLTLALNGHMRRETLAAPPELRANAEALERLERADYVEQLRSVETDAERESLTKRWLRSYRI